ncbi:MAG TPA: ATP12 family protein [Devosia sp.]|nr:ATP12 family protein [Devosia sp.]
MREFLEDAHEHREDGYGRAQAHAAQQLPKRFYKEVGVASLEGGYGVTLDGKSPRTPGMKLVTVPNRAVAEAMAAEWRAQGEYIDPMTMPLTRIVNSAVEAGEEAVPALRDEIVKYASNDLLLYRAESPESLVRRQEEIWDGLLVELARHFGIAFQPTIGIVHQAQPAANAVKLAAALADENLFGLTAINAITSITGSGLLAIAHRHGLADREQVWVAAHLDEDHNIGLWGEVEEITERRAKRRLEFDAAADLLQMLNAKS